MKKINVKIITSIMITIMIISVTVTVFAIRPDEVNVNGDLNDEGVFKEFGEKALGIIQTIGIVGSVIILMVAGIKYMTGSLEEKADYKKALLPYVVGVIILFSATTIANLVYQIANPATEPSGSSTQDAGTGGTEKPNRPTLPGEDDFHTRE